MSFQPEVVLNILGAVLAAVSAVIAFILSGIRKKKTEEKTSEKIDRLSNLLKSASSEIEELEKEVTHKSKKLQELSDISRALEGLVSLKEKQAEAIKQELRATLKESNRSNRLWTIFIGALWFLLGLFVRGFLGF